MWLSPQDDKEVIQNVKTISDEEKKQNEKTVEEEILNEKRANVEKEIQNEKTVVEDEIQNIKIANDTILDATEITDLKCHCKVQLKNQELEGMALFLS